MKRVTNWFVKTINSTLGQKMIMSLTGLFLISFLVIHLTGNLMLFKDDGGASFNAYAHFMSTSSFIKLAEIFLVLGFGMHIYTAWRLTRYNKQVRPQAYAYSRPEVNSPWTARYMGFVGSIMLIFLLIHLYHFWFKYKFQIEVPATGDYKDLYLLVQTTFVKEWWISVLYIVSMVFFGLHLVHGFESSLQTLGIQHKKYTPMLKKVGLLFAIIVPMGFAVMPLYFIGVYWW
ncbi:succinate dehydrogenase cytochrome b subunit [Candidatus Halobeggiatoa sp. HSG11]|nr:succinate dehydrogenase cytochrome b subunit [Candidatus Halobeggiatoa sp. HSG11]